MKNIDWNDKEVVLAALNQNGRALEYAPNDLQNDKDVVLTAVNQDGTSLKYASDKLQNDFELLTLLKNYHIDKNINIDNGDYHIWYKKRIRALGIINEQIELEKLIPKNNTKINKLGKF